MFFKHENQAFPPAISNDGDLYPTQKSNIVSLLESYCDVEYIQPLAEEIIIDGSAFVYSLSPQAGTFSEYCKQTFAEKKFANSAFSTVELMWSLTNINMTV